MKRYMVILVAHLFCSAAQVHGVVDTLDCSAEVAAAGRFLASGFNKLGCNPGRFINGEPVNHDLRRARNEAYHAVLHRLFPEGKKKTEALKDKSKVASVEDRRQLPQLK